MTTTETVRHVILNRPLRCFEQMITAYKMAERLGAETHLTPGCYGEATRRPARPGMGSGCMPLDPIRGADRCRHDLAALRAEGAVEIGPETECWSPSGQPCPTCGGRWRTDGLMWFSDEYPDQTIIEQPALTLF